MSIKLRENKRSVLLLINFFNDVDHSAPLILELLEREFFVHIICLTRFDISADLRIQHFRSWPNFTLHPLHLLPRSNARSNKTSAGLGLGRKIIRELLFNKIWGILFLSFYRINAVIFTWGRPRSKGLQRRVFLAADLLSLPTLCIPHGQNIYINYDVNKDIKEYYRENGQWPNFEDRNEFTKYVVQTNRHRRQHIDWGMHPGNVFAWGSLRFDPEWISYNFRLYQKSGRLYQDNLGYPTRIVFFLPHWRYNVDSGAVLQLLTFLLDQLEDSFVIIKGHTRGDCISDEDIKTLSMNGNVAINSPVESTPLIEWANVVINFGSSIALEAIVKQKTVIFPYYLHSNQTIFDNCTAVMACESDEAVLNAINQPRSPHEDIESRVIVENEVFNNDQTHPNIAHHYADHLERAIDS